MMRRSIPAEASTNPTSRPVNRDCHRGTRCTGIFFRNTWLRPIKLASITDGTSKTFMIGEDVPGLQSPFGGILFERRLVLVQRAA